MANLILSILLSSISLSLWAQNYNSYQLTYSKKGSYSYKTTMERAYIRIEENRIVILRAEEEYSLVSKKEIKVDSFNFEEEMVLEYIQYELHPNPYNFKAIELVVDRENKILKIKLIEAETEKTLSFNQLKPK